jgi:hypothetical protein
MSMLNLQNLDLYMKDLYDHWAREFFLIISSHLLLSCIGLPHQVTACLLMHFLDLPFIFSIDVHSS